MTEATEETTVNEISPEQIKNIGLYQMLQFNQAPDGRVSISVVQVPVPVAMIEQFQEQFGEEMAEENLKLVVYKGKIFLAPAKTSSLIGFN